jgi:hypothetical protein
MDTNKAQLIKTLKDMRKQLQDLSSMKIRDAAKEIDTYLKAAQAEQARRDKGGK